MNKTVIGVVVGLLVVGGLVAAVTLNKKAEPQTHTTQSQSDNMSNMATDHSSTSSTTPATSSEAVQSNNVTIQDYSYSPSTITIKAGTKVTWTNQDSVGHDVAPDKDYGDAFVGSDDLISKGESYSYTFNKAGTYTYHCSPHPYMKATVIVTE